MITINAVKDIPNKSIAIDTVYDAPRQAVWDAWTQGDKLEQWWGPEGWPATSVEMDFREGGHWHYKMTSDADGTEAHGWTDYTEIVPIDHFTGLDYFCSPDGQKDTSLPASTWNVTFEDQDGKTHLTAKLTLGTEAELNKLIEMGFEEGFKMGLQNLERLLAKETA